MNGRQAGRPPRPEMVWSRKRRMWLDPDTRSRVQKASDRRMLRNAERERHRFKGVLRRLAAPGRRWTSRIDSAATGLAGGLLASLIEARKRSGLSQAEVARRMGVPQPAVVRLESGVHSPTLATLARFAAAIGVTLEVRRPA